MTTAVRLILIALILAACTAQVPLATPPASTPSAPPQPSTSPHPSASPEPDPEPSVQPAIAWEPAWVQPSANASAMVSIVPGGDGWVAIGFDGAFGSLLWTSADGMTWRDVTPPGWESVGIASVVQHDGRLIGVGRGNTLDVDTQEAAVYLSDDGLAWQKVDTAAQLIGQMIDVVATDDGLYAVGGVPGADAASIWHSTDGQIWQRSGPDIEGAFLWAIAEGGPGLVAVGWRRTPDPSAAVWTSTDGTDWIQAPDPEAFERFEATDVLAAADGTMVMTGSSFTGEGGQMWFSTDGLDWQLADVEGGLDGRYARTAALTVAGLVAVGGGDDMAARTWHSTDGRSWQPVGESVPGAFFHAAFAMDDGLLAVGATQAGTLETGIEAHAAIWSASLSD